MTLLLFFFLIFCRGAFSQLKFVMHLDLSSCHIETIETGAFQVRGHQIYQIYILGRKRSICTFKQTRTDLLQRNCEAIAADKHKLWLKGTCFLYCYALVLHLFRRYFFICSHLATLCILGMFSFVLCAFKSFIKLLQKFETFHCLELHSHEV